MPDVGKRVPPTEKVRLRKLTAAHGKAYVGVELEYRSLAGDRTRLDLGLAPDDAAALGAKLSQLGEKLRSTEH